MKAAPFEYVRPATVGEALELLADEESKPIAGGQSLVPMMAMRLVRPARLVDLGRLGDLHGLRLVDDFVEVGAGVRQRTAERSEVVRKEVPLAAAALPFVGHREIRNRGTIGGSLAHADPTAELLLVAATLAATLVVRGCSGERSVEADGFAAGPLQTVLEPGELLTRVRLPRAIGGDGFAFEEVARRHGDFALCGAAVAMRRRDGHIERARLGLMGVGPVPVVHELRDELEGPGGQDDPPVFARVAESVADRHEPSGDMHASAGYRRRLARVLAERCLERAWQDAGAAA